MPKPNSTADDHFDPDHGLGSDPVDSLPGEFWDDDDEAGQGSPVQSGPVRIEFQAPRDFALKRLDVVLSGLAPDISRSRLQAIIAAGQVTVNDRTVTTPSSKVHPHHHVVAVIPPTEDAELVPDTGPVDVLFEDDDVLVLNKPAGLSVHPGAGRITGTLLNRLIARPGFNASVGGRNRPGLVHRLDMDTSGAMVVAKTDRAYQSLRSQLDDRTMTRRYVALAWRPFRDAMGSIEATIGRHPSQRMKMSVRSPGDGRYALTHYRVLEPYGPLSLVECALETGRTHQIRVHLAHTGHAVVNDSTYGGGFDRMGELLPQTWQKVRTALLQSPRQLLHAWRLRFIHPTTQESVEFEAPLPEDMLKVVEALRDSIAKPLT